jgi:dephospho-CoA kinase
MKKIIGLAGEIASGKGTAAKYLKEKCGASSARFSTMLRDVLDRLYLPQSRENMQILSAILRQNFGEDLFAKVMACDVKNDASDVIVVDGMRRPADIKYLQELQEFELIYIESETKKRYERLILRNENPGDTKKTFEQFKKEQEQEAESQIRELKKLAHYVVNNDGNYEGLYKQIDHIIKEPLLYE